MNVSKFRAGVAVDTPRVAGGAPVNSSVLAATAPPGIDRQLALTSALVAGWRLAVATRRERLRVLEARVRGGTYVADAAMIASEMVAEADLAVGLRTLAHA